MIRFSQCLGLVLLGHGKLQNDYRLSVLEHRTKLSFQDLEEMTTKKHKRRKIQKSKRRLIFLVLFVHLCGYKCLSERLVCPHPVA